MARMNRVRAALGAGGALALAFFLALGGSRKEARAVVTEAAQGEPPASPASSSEAVAARAVEERRVESVPDADGHRDQVPQPRTVLRLPYGAGAGQVGRTHGTGPEDNEGPMGISVGADGTTLIADTVNGRIVRYARDGTELPPLRATSTLTHAIAFPDGRIAAWEETGGGPLTFYDRDGVLIRTEGARAHLGRAGRVDDFVAMRNELVAKVQAPGPYGVLPPRYLDLASSRGDWNEPPRELPGYPFADGSGFVVLRALPRVADQARVSVVVADQTTVRWSRSLRFEQPLADAQIAGVSSTGVIVIDARLRGDGHGAATSEALLVCLDASDGSERRRMSVPILGDDPPDFLFRHLSVTPDGRVRVMLYARGAMEVREVEC